MPYLLVFVVLVAAAAVALVLGRTGGMSVPMSAAVSTQGWRDLPEGEVTSDAIHAVRFDRAVRGYRMDQVDSVLARLAQEAAQREARLRELALAAGGGFVALVPGADGPDAPPDPAVASPDAQEG
jgi:DivIVA domain-containing protein